MDKFKEVIAKNVIRKMPDFTEETITPLLNDNAAELGLLLLKEARDRSGEDYDEACNTLFDRFAKR